MPRLWAKTLKTSPGRIVQIDTVSVAGPLHGVSNCVGGKKTPISCVDSSCVRAKQFSDDAIHEIGSI